MINKVLNRVQFIAVEVCSLLGKRIATFLLWRVDILGENPPKNALIRVGYFFKN